MPQPRKYKTNAERQAAYRERKRIAEATAATTGARLAQTPGTQAVVRRVMAADRAAQT